LSPSRWIGSEAHIPEPLAGWPPPTCYYVSMTNLDPTGRTGKITSMMGKFIRGAMRDSVEEVLGKRFDEINGSLKSLDARLVDCSNQTVALGARLDARIDQMGTRIDEMGTRLDARIDEMGGRIDEMGTRLGARIDEMGGRIDEMGARLDARIDETGNRLDELADRFSVRFDEFSRQQGRLIEEVVYLKGDVGALKLAAD